MSRNGLRVLTVRCTPQCDSPRTVILRHSGAAYGSSDIRSPQNMHTTEGLDPKSTCHFKLIPIFRNRSKHCLLSRRPRPSFSGRTILSTRSSVSRSTFVFSINLVQLNVSAGLTISARKWQGNESPTVKPRERVILLVVRRRDTNALTHCASVSVRAYATSAYKPPPSPLIDNQDLQLKKEAGRHSVCVQLHP